MNDSVQMPARTINPVILPRARSSLRLSLIFCGGAGAAGAGAVVGAGAAGAGADVGAGASADASVIDAWCVGGASAGCVPGRAGPVPGDDKGGSFVVRIPEGEPL